MYCRGVYRRISRSDRDSNEFLPVGASLCGCDGYTIARFVEGVEESGRGSAIRNREQFVRAAAAAAVRRKRSRLSVKIARRTPEDVYPAINRMGGDISDVG